MITRKQIIIAVREYIDDTEFTDLPPEEWEFDSVDFLSILEYIDVPDARDRLKMYNRGGSFDLDDLEALANVNFHVVECDMCGIEVYVVRPDDWGKFQGIWTNGEIGPVDINGREKEICEQCYGNPIFY